MKSNNRRKAGELQPIPLPERGWRQITTDMVIDFPESEGKTIIIVFVDHLTKMTHMVSCTKEVAVSQYGRLFVNNIFRLHGTPEVIISNRDPSFVRKFWEELFSLLGTDLWFNTDFHSQTDGKS